MERNVTRRDVLGASGAAVAFGVAGCLGAPSGGQPTFDGTLAVSEAHQYSAPGCGCCGEDAASLRGYLDTDLVETEADAVAALKDRHGVPDDLLSCHTLVLDGSVVEGHVPVAAIATLFEDEPEVDGIALPGMPAGSPGMGGSKDGPFRVYAFTDGERGDVFAEL
jgi:hypothetical protein